jgi:hypothetical protein
MAIPLVIANTVQVRILWALSGQGAVNVLHGIVATGFVVNQSVANTLGSAVKAAFTTHLASLMPANCGITKVGLRDIRIANGTEFLDAGTAASGSAVGDPLPTSTALCVTLRTDKAGKSFRGRTYLGGFAETQNDTNAQASAATATSALAFMAALDTAFDGSSITMAVASRPAERYTVVRTTFHDDGTTTVKTITQGQARTGQSNPVTLFQNRTALWESQRRRANGRGAVVTLLGTGSQTVPSLHGSGA